MAKNSLANLPYILDGSNVITQSNSCLLFLGTKLGIDKPDCMIYNHQVNARSGSGARRTVAHAARWRTPHGGARRTATHGPGAHRPVVTRVLARPLPQALDQVMDLRNELMKSARASQRPSNPLVRVMGRGWPSAAPFGGHDRPATILR